MGLKSKSGWMGTCSFFFSLIALFIILNDIFNVLNFISSSSFLLILIILSLVFGLIAIYKNKGRKMLALLGIIISLMILLFLIYVMMNVQVNTFY